MCIRDSDNLISGSLNKLFTAERAAAKKVQEEENRTKDRDNGIGGSSGGAPGSSQSAELSNAFSSPLQEMCIRDRSDVATDSLQQRRRKSEMSYSCPLCWLR